MDDGERGAVAARLREYLRRIDEVCGQIDGGPSALPGGKSRTRELMRALKSELKEDYRRLCRKNARDQLDDAEHAFLRPAVQGAFNHIKVRWNSNPSSWLPDLHEARIDIEHYLAEIMR